MKKKGSSRNLSKKKNSVKSTTSSSNIRSSLQPASHFNGKTFNGEKISESKRDQATKKSQVKGRRKSKYSQEDMMSIVLRDFHTNKKIRLHRSAGTIISLRFTLNPTIKRVKVVDQPEQFVKKINNWQLYIADYDKDNNINKGFYHIQFIAKCKKGCFHLVDRTSLTEMDEITILRCLTEKTDRIIRPGDKIKLNMVSLYNLLRNPDFRFLHNLLTLYNKRRDQN